MTIQIPVYQDLANAKLQNNLVGVYFLAIILHYKTTDYGKIMGISRIEKYSIYFASSNYTY